MSKYGWLFFGAAVVCLVGIASVGTGMQWGKWRNDRRAQHNSVIHTQSERGEDWRGEWWTVHAILPLSGELLISPLGVEERIHDFFQATKYKLLMAYYRLDDKALSTLLCTLRHRGVYVQLLHESFPYESYAGTTMDTWFERLQRILGACDIPVKGDDALPVSFSHEKVSLADEKYLISTANLTYTSFRRNREYRVIGDNKEVRRSLEHVLMADWSGGTIPLGVVHPNLLVCPLNCREHLKWLLEAAEQEVIIEAQYIQDKEIVAILKDLLKKPWFRLQIIVGEYQALGWLDDLKPYVRMFSSYYVHAKVLLVDQKYMLVGSMNFSTQAIENNREVSIILTDKANMRRFLSQFEKDREQWYELKSKKDFMVPQ